MIATDLVFVLARMLTSCAAIDRATRWICACLLIARCTADGELISTLKLWQVGFEKQPVPAAIAKQVLNESVADFGGSAAMGAQGRYRGC